MKKILPVIFFLVSTTASFAQGLEDWYAFLSDAAGIDSNAGRRALLTLILPPGGLYQSMGTAYTAVAKDSGYIEANPAGGALLQDTELAVYHNDWIGDSRLEGLIFTIRKDDFGFGFGGKWLYMPFTAIDNWGRRYVRDPAISTEFAKGNYTEFVATGNLSYNFLNSFYFNGITLGGSFKLAGRIIPDSIYPGQSALTALVDLGAITRFNFLKFYPSRQRNVSIGLALKNVGPPVGQDPVPTNLTLGLAYSPIRPLTISLDGTLPIELSKDFNLGSLGAVSAGSSKAESASAAAGMDLIISDFMSVQAGLEIKPGRPRLSAGTTFALSKVTLSVNYTVDLMTTLAAFDRISILARFNLGDLGRKAAEDTARTLYLEGLSLYTNGDLVGAIEKWKKALEYQPNFSPAQEFMETAIKALELKKQLDATFTNLDPKNGAPAK